MHHDLLIDATTSLVDCAFKVCTLFARNNKTIVLTGGSAATVYSDEAYMSSDIDFMIAFHGPSKEENEALVSLGYQPGSSYRHKDNPVTLEFINEQIYVGEKQVTAWNTLRQDRLLLHILTPTDCVLDRLSGAVHWSDVSAARQAALVAQKQNVDYSEIEKWCKSEDPNKGPQVYKDFCQLHNRL